MNEILANQLRALLGILGEKAYRSPADQDAITSARRALEHWDAARACAAYSNGEQHTKRRRR